MVVEQGPLEEVVTGVDLNWWSGKRVFLTGHTGFKGSWLSLWLSSLGAEVHGYSLAPPTRPSLFEDARLDLDLQSTIADVRDFSRLKQALTSSQPEIVFHLAAQPLVRLSYEEPLATFEANVMGTANLLQAVRGCETARVCLVVTSDKCYRPSDGDRGYLEQDAMGGDDPYSASKGCAELVTHSFRHSFFRNSSPQVGVASARAGNVIGGGDWAQDRLVPDLVRALKSRQPVALRYPEAIRPWQHVLEPLSGYLALVRRLWDDPVAFAEGWNFGPSGSEAHTVREVVVALEQVWDYPCATLPAALAQPELHEAMMLRLDSSASERRLEWSARLSFADTMEWTARWYRAYLYGEDARELTMDNIKKFQEIAI